MDKIPIEIFERICNVMDDKRSLKALRLVNKNFANIAERYLFETLIVLQRISSWRKIERIAHCPRLAPLVKKLELVPMIVGPDTRIFGDWKQKSQSHRVQGQLRLGNRSAAVAELVEPHDDKLAMVLRLQQRYQTWLWWDIGRYAMERFAALGVDRFLSVIPLPALTEIETAWPPDQRALGLYPGRWENRANLRPNTVDLFGPLDFNKRCNAHLSCALLGLHESGLKITTLELHQYREILLDQMYPAPTLPYLKHLKLHFHHQFTVGTKLAMAINNESHHFEWILAPYLAEAENLETLILTQDPLAERYTKIPSVWFDVIPVLSTASWPKLRSVWFGENFARSTSMLQFIMKHGKSLRTIHLDHPACPEIPWQRLASDLRTEHANHDCVVSGRDDAIFHSKSACIEE